jgi:hypothetical protein
LAVPKERNVLVADARNGLRNVTLNTISTPPDNAALLLIDVQDCFLDKYTTSGKVKEIIINGYLQAHSLSPFLF